MQIAAFYTCPMALRIRAIRTERGLSQQLLADKAGLSRSQLSEIENEAKPANTLRLNAIAAALGVEVNELFEGNAIPAYQKELSDLIDAMGEADRELLLQTARALARRN
jgi:transcriptional regulator with XRE-family HTH domain